MAYITFKNVDKIYKMGEVEIKALDKTTFDVEKVSLFVYLVQVEQERLLV